MHELFRSSELFPEAEEAHRAASRAAMLHYPGLKDPGDRKDRETMLAPGDCLVCCRHSTSNPSDWDVCNPPLPHPPPPTSTHNSEVESLRGMGTTLGLVMPRSVNKQKQSWNEWHSEPTCRKTNPPHPEFPTTHQFLQHL